MKPRWGWKVLYKQCDGSLASASWRGRTVYSENAWTVPKIDHGPFSVFTDKAEAARFASQDSAWSVFRCLYVPTSGSQLYCPDKPNFPLYSGVGMLCIFNDIDPNKVALAAAVWVKGRTNATH